MRRIPNETSHTDNDVKPPRERIETHGWGLSGTLTPRLLCRKRAEGLAMAKVAAEQLVGKPPPAPDLRKQILDWIKKP